jgi:ABC-type Na+ efflux pump permease subunit
VIVFFVPSGKYAAAILAESSSLSSEPIALMYTYWLEAVASVTARTKLFGSSWSVTPVPTVIVPAPAVSALAFALTLYFVPSRVTSLATVNVDTSPVAVAGAAIYLISSVVLVAFTPVTTR